MRLIRVRFSNLVIVAMLLAACGVSEPIAEPAPTPSTTTSSPTTTAMTSPASTTESVSPPTSMEQQAVADLASRMEVDPTEIDVAEVEEVTWSDGSLGCPQPGKMYTQALVDGTRIILVYEGEEYAYHQGADGQPFLCPEPGQGKSIPPKGPIGDY